jgi:hypothetical protein
MTKHRATSMLFAVAASGVSVAAADPTPIQPRTLRTGAPACGNVVGKSGYGPPMIEAPVCKAARVILTAVSQDLEQIRRVLAVFDWQDHVAKTPALTLAEGDRPRS